MKPANSPFQPEAKLLNDSTVCEDASVSICEGREHRRRVEVGGNGPVVLTFRGEKGVYRVQQNVSWNLTRTACLCGCAFSFWK